METDFEVIVLGAGFTGSALIAQLCQLAPPGTRLLLAGEETGLGLAYGAAAPRHLLNVAAGGMSLYPDQPDDFVQWLTANGHAAEQAEQGLSLPRRFLPRAVYGEYVHDRLTQAIAASGCQITRRVARATALERRGDRWQVTFADGALATAVTVAICVGNLPGALPLPAAAVGQGAEARVIRDPWRDPRLAAIGPADRVLVIGTGLTMVDLVMQRAHDGHTGQTIALSRRGLLPEVHALAPEPGVRIPGIEEPRTLAELTRLVRAAIAARAADGGDWRPVVDGLRPETQRLWMSLTAREQSRFLRLLGAHWGVARHRMPPIAGARLAAMRSAGQLTIVAGRIVNLAAQADGRLRATLLPRGAGQPATEVVDWVVNCTGPGRDPARTGNPFLLALLAAGIARRDALGLGLETDEADRVLAAGGSVHETLYALGPVAMGRRYEIVAVPDLRQQAAAVAARIAGGRAPDLPRPS